MRHHANEHKKTLKYFLERSRAFFEKLSPSASSAATSSVKKANKLKKYATSATKEKLHKVRVLARG
jgi:hypothetical protein